MSIQQPTKYKILLIGDRCTDVYQFGTVDRISPEAPVPVFTHTNEESRPGMAANVLENLTVLGCDVNFISGTNSRKTRLIDTRSKQHIIRIDHDEYCDPVDVKTINFLMFDAIVVSDYNKGTVSYETVEELRKLYKGPIFVDTKKPDVHRFEGCYVKVNSTEYSKLTSVCSNLIVTLGGDGAKMGDVVYPAPRVEVSDVCGAGDTFLAALTYEYLSSNDIVKAIKFAIKASAITVQNLGVYAPTSEEISKV
jgi:D-beta-D-heptose 7-phosphate kinase/D-beta-D-heptose 1-phosphate adenosyltransferase